MDNGYVPRIAEFRQPNTKYSFVVSDRRQHSMSSLKGRKEEPSKWAGSGQTLGGGSPSASTRHPSGGGAQGTGAPGQQHTGLGTPALVGVVSALAAQLMQQHVLGSTSANVLVTFLAGIAGYAVTEKVTGSGAGLGGLAIFAPKEKEIVLCDDKPKTTIQFRYVGVEDNDTGTGSTKKLTVSAREAFNQHVHTVGDVRARCAALSKQPVERIELFAGYPPKAIAEDKDAETLDAAGLCGAAVTIRLKNL